MQFANMQAGFEIANSIPGEGGSSNKNCWSFLLKVKYVSEYARWVDVKLLLDIIF